MHPTDGNAPTATTDGLANGRTLVDLTAGAHTLSVVEAPDVSGPPGADPARLGHARSSSRPNHDAAVAAAKNAKTAVVFAWDDRVR